MPKKETFLLVSLEEEKAKKLAQVISNPSCRKILDFLAVKSGTETSISSELKLPLSTVHYNLQHLLNSGLVDADRFHYSSKGKEVLHYSLANKYVIIAPKAASDSFIEKLKSLVPAFIIVGALGLIASMFSRTYTAGTFGAQELMTKSMEAAPAADAARGVMLQETAVASTQTIAQTSQAMLPMWFWFILGAVLMIIVYLLIEWARKRLKK